MTLTNQSFFEAKDVLSIRISCEICPSAMTLPITELKQVPYNCPHCGAEWFQRGTADYNAFRHFVESIRVLQHRTKDTKALLHFELKTKD
jgi:hypothetical protein